jgi:hypothetical protein
LLDDFTFIVGDHRYRYQSSVAQSLLLRVSKLHWNDAAVSELRLEVEDGGEVFGSVSEAAGGGSIAIDSARRRTFAGICSTLWNSELYQSFCPVLFDKVTMESVSDRLQLLSATRCGISTERQIIASHLYAFLCRCDTLMRLLLPMICGILGHGSLRLGSEDGLYCASLLWAPKRTGK